MLHVSFGSGGVQLGSGYDLQVVEQDLDPTLWNKRVNALAAPWFFDHCPLVPVIGEICVLQDKNLQVRVGLSAGCIDEVFWRKCRPPLIKQHPEEKNGEKIFENRISLEDTLSREKWSAAARSLSEINHEEKGIWF